MAEEASMEAQTIDMDQMIHQLNELIIPSTLMESFDAYREESVRASSIKFTETKLSRFLEMLNAFRGTNDRKDTLLDIFDPSMFTINHPAWTSPPGTHIEMPSLTSHIAVFAGQDSEFAAAAERQ